MPIFNPHGNGHYIVNYDDQDTQKLIEAKIIDRSLNSSGRIISLNDMLLRAQKAEHSLTDILNLVLQCSGEDRDAVWAPMFRALGFGQLLTDDDEDSEDLFKIIKGQVSKDWYKKLGWDDRPNDDPNTKQLRTTILAASLASEQRDIVDIALDKMKRAKTIEALPAEQRSLIAATVVHFGEKKYIQKFMDEYLSSQNPEVRSSITAALCATRDPKVARQIVEWGMNNDEIIRPQDIDHWFAYLMRNRHTRQVAWDWLVDRWPHLLKLFGDGKKMEYFIWYASRSISSPEWYKKYRKFFEPMLNDASMKRNILISFAEIEARIAWRQRERDNILAWLKAVTK